MWVFLNYLFIFQAKCWFMSWIAENSLDFFLSMSIYVFTRYLRNNRFVYGNKIKYPQAIIVTAIMGNVEEVCLSCDCDWDTTWRTEGFVVLVDCFNEFSARLHLKRRALKLRLLRLPAYCCSLFRVAQSLIERVISAFAKLFA